MNKSKYLLIAREYGLYLGLVICGLGLVGVGTVKAIRQNKTEQHPEFTQESTATPSAMPIIQTIVVDVSGAVKMPGVYRLPAENRIGEAIAAAGGFTKDADVRYVSKQINLAASMVDGMKIYVPAWGEEQAEAESVSETLVSINHATQAELEELWGIGAARATAIIESRPYAAIEEIVSKANLPQSILDKNLGKISL